MQTVEQPVSLADCPPGLFMFGDTLGFKTEYMAMETVGAVDVPGDQIRWKVSRWPDAYVVASGEYFWGGTSKHSDRAALLVRPVDRFEASLPPSAPVDRLELTLDEATHLLSKFSQAADYGADRDRKIYDKISAMIEAWPVAERPPGHSMTPDGCKPNSEIMEGMVRDFG